MLFVASSGVTEGLAATAAHREIMWNMGLFTHIAMYALMVVSFVIFGFGLRRRIRFWKMGKPEAERAGDWGKRLWIMIRETFLQNQARNRPLPAVFHSMIFYSFVMLFIATLIVMADMDFGIDIFHGTFYLVISLLADLAGAFLLVGLVIAAVRRYFSKPKFLPETKPVDTWVLAILAFLALTGFLAEGARIAHHPNGDPWRAYTPVGSAFAALVGGLSPAGGRALHFGVWWVHALGTFAMIALIPFTKFFHMLSIPTNQFLRKLEPKGTLARVDIEELFASDDMDEDFTLGVSQGQHLNWKQRLDLDACIHCGRCDEICPAWAVDQPLSPRRLIEDIKEICETAYAAWLKREKAAGHAAGHGGDHGAGNAIGGAAAGATGAAGEDENDAACAILGHEKTVFEDPEFIWHCRTCHACQTVCPAAIEHVDLFVELRRSEVMMEGRLPTDAGKALKTMEAQGNPFGSQAERMDLVEKLEIPVLKAGEETEVLFWIGCATTFDPQKHQIAADMVAIMRAAGIKFAHLGKDEGCCGDPARVLGDENLFQMTAKATVEALKSRTFRHLLVICPHGYNVFKNEYPQFGADLPVIHHTELLAEWIREGRIKLEKPLSGTVTFHDPCYLGRYQGVFDPPRDVLRAIPGLQVREMASHHDRSFCCGAGGGHFWMDIDQGDGRTYSHRVDEAQAAGASTIAVGCAFCYQMLLDGTKARDLDESMAIKDIASLVRESLGS